MARAHKNTHALLNLLQDVYGDAQIVSYYTK